MLLDELRAGLEDLARREPQGAPDPRHAVQARAGRRRRRRRILMGVGGALTALFAALATWTAVANDRTAHRISVSTPTGGATNLPGAIQDSDWSSVSKRFAGLGTATAFHAVATGSRSLLLAGARLQLGRWQPAIWYSYNGKRWSSARVPTTGGEVVAIAAKAKTALAIGVASDSTSSFVWRSVDNGRHWTAIASGRRLFGAPTPKMGRPFVLGLLEWHGTWVATGGGSDGYAAVWTSTDGRRWRQVLQAPNARPAGSIDITTAGTRDLFGYWVTNGWYSATARTWNQPVSLAVPDRSYLLTVAPGVAVAFGDNLDRHGVPTPLLRSRDNGNTWTVDPRFLMQFPGARVSTVTRANDLWLATGWSGAPNHPDAWVSRDLTNWQALPRALYGKPGGVLDLIAVVGDRAVLIGSAPELDRFYTLDAPNRPSK
jgi:hypothetical protein